MQVLGFMRKKALQMRIRIIEFMTPFDKLRRGSITAGEFRRFDLFPKHLLLITLHLFAISVIASPVRFWLLIWCDSNRAMELCLVFSELSDVEIHAASFLFHEQSTVVLNPDYHILSFV